jgi:hypothetical protein
VDRADAKHGWHAANGFGRVQSSVGIGSRQYSASAKVTGASTTTYQTLLDPGTWHFSVVAVNAAGEESPPSNEVSKTVC